MHHGLDFSLEELCGGLSNKGHMGIIDANLRPAQTVPGPKFASRECSVTHPTLSLTLQRKGRYQRRGSRVDCQLIVQDTTYSQDGGEDLIKTITAPVAWPKLCFSLHIIQVSFSEILYAPKKLLTHVNLLAKEERG